MCFLCRNEQKGKKGLQGLQGENHAALTEIGTVNILYTLKDRQSLGKRGSCQKKEERRNMQASGPALMSKAVPFTLLDRQKKIINKSNQSQETGPENKQGGKLLLQIER